MKIHSEKKAGNESHSFDFSLSAGFVSVVLAGVFTFIIIVWALRNGKVEDFLPYFHFLKQSM